MFKVPLLFNTAFLMEQENAFGCNKLRAVSVISALGEGLMLSVLGFHIEEGSFRVLSPYRECELC